MAVTGRKLRKRVEELLQVKAPTHSSKYYFLICVVLTGAVLVWSPFKTEHNPLGIHLKSKYDFLSPIYSTPIYLYDSIIALATQNGNLIWYNFTTSKVLNKVNIESKTIAPLNKIDVNEDDRAEVLISTMQNGYSLFESSAEYLYKTREGSSIKSIIAKPLVYQYQGKRYLLLVGEEGDVELLETSYGKTVWRISLRLLTDESIVSSPILMDEKQAVYITGTKGSCFSINILNSQIIWHTNLTSTFIATGVITHPFKKNNRQNNVLSLISTQGVFFQLDTKTGKTISKTDLNTPATSSLAAYHENKKDHIILLGKGGAIYRINKDGFFKIYDSPKDGPFQASPIISDLNKDDKKDIIAVHSTGKIALLNSDGRLICDPYYLKSEVTATPLLITLDRTYLVIAGENGKLFVLMVQEGQKNISPSHPYLEFLNNSSNNYYL